MGKVKWGIAMKQVIKTVLLVVLAFLLAELNILVVQYSVPLFGTHYHWLIFAALTFGAIQGWGMYSIVDFLHAYNTKKKSGV